MIHQFLQRSGDGEYINTKFAPHSVEIFDSPKFENCLVYGGQFFDSPTCKDSSFNGFCRVSGRPDIRRSHVSGTAQINGFSRVVDSVVSGNAVVTKNAQVRSSEISDNSRILEDAYVENCAVSEQAMICGKAVVVGKGPEKMVINGWTYISEGWWHRPPMSFVCQSGYVVTESIERNISIGCITNTVEKWKSGAGEKYGKLLGLDKSGIDEIRYYVNEIEIRKNQPDYDMRGK
jgi:uncharacterized protein YuzB (UPF0349 family)